MRILVCFPLFLGALQDALRSTEATTGNCRRKCFEAWSDTRIRCAADCADEFRRSTTTIQFHALVPKEKKIKVKKRYRKRSRRCKQRCRTKAQAGIRVCLAQCAGTAAPVPPVVRLEFVGRGACADDDGNRFLACFGNFRNTEAGCLRLAKQTTGAIGAVADFEEGGDSCSILFVDVENGEEFCFGNGDFEDPRDSGETVGKLPITKTVVGTFGKCFRKVTGE